MQPLLAYYLSQISRAVMAVLRETGRKLKDLAESIGEDPRTVRRKLTGEYVATFDGRLLGAVPGRWQ